MDEPHGSFFWKIRVKFSVWQFFTRFVDAFFSNVILILIQRSGRNYMETFEIVIFVFLM